MTRDDEVALPEEEGFASGEVARADAVLRAERLATSAWREQGHEDEAKQYGDWTADLRIKA